jgi:hypothetical protein
VKNFLVSGALVAFIVAAQFAIAAKFSEFSTRKCIMEIARPAMTATAVLDNNAFKTKSTVEMDMKAMVCGQ